MYSWGVSFSCPGSASPWLRSDIKEGTLVNQRRRDQTALRTQGAAASHRTACAFRCAGGTGAEGELQKRLVNLSSVSCFQNST